MKKRFKGIAKKAIALGLVATMSLGVATGCGSKKKNEVITLTVFSQRANSSGEQQGWSAKLLLDEFNVKLNIVPDQGGALQTKMESGDLGDIVVLGEGPFQQCIDAGLLFDWDEDDLLSEYGPVIKDNMKNAITKSRGLSKDGKLYGVGNECSTDAKNTQSFFYTWDIRWDLYEQLGRPSYKNYDDMVEVFKQMKEICPEDDNGNPTYAVSLWNDWDGDMVMYVKSTATSYTGYEGDFGVGHYNPINGEFYGALDENSPYLQALKFFNKLNQNNLIDPDSATMKYEQASAKVTAGGTFFSIFDYAGNNLFNTDEHIKENKIMRSLVAEEASPIVYGQKTTGGNCYWGIGAQTQYPELCMEIINYLATPEGYMNIEYGPRGVTWDYDEKGNTYFTELGKKTIVDGNTQMTGDYSGAFKDGQLQINCIAWTRDCPNPDSNGETYNYKEWKLEQGEPRNEADASWREFAGATSINEYMKSGKYVVCPDSNYVAPEKSDEFETTWKQVTGCIVEYSWKAILAKDDAEYDKVVDEMIKKADQYGYQEVVDWCVKEAAVRKAAEDEMMSN